jgi:hypothetical protein
MLVAVAVGPLALEPEVLVVLAVVVTAVMVNMEPLRLQAQMALLILAAAAAGLEQSSAAPTTEQMAAKVLLSFKFYWQLPLQTQQAHQPSLLTPPIGITNSPIPEQLLFKEA